MKSNKEFFESEMGGKKCTFFENKARVRIFDSKAKRPKLYVAGDLVIYALAIGLMAAMVWKTLTGGR